MLSACKCNVSAVQDDVWDKYLLAADNKRSLITK